MFPGMGGRMDPRRMNQMMRQLGIDVQEIPNVTEVLIRTPEQEYRFENPDVTVMTAQGQKTYQVVGKPTTTRREAQAATIKDEDVALVSEQTGKSAAEARAALEATQGDIAEAILKLAG